MQRPHFHIHKQALHRKTNRLLFRSSILTGKTHYISSENFVFQQNFQKHQQKING